MGNLDKNICNKCGKSLIPNDIHEAISESPCGLIDAEVTGGYFSEGLLDLNNYKFSICEICLRKLFNEFKIPPEVNEINSNFDGSLSTLKHVDWLKDQEIFELQEWKENGGSSRAYLKGLCNQIKDCPNKASYSIKLSDELTNYCMCNTHKDGWGNCINAEIISFDSSWIK